jgi:single-strand DNA-binding protein
MSINCVSVSGNIGRCELRATSNGGNVLTFSLAVNERVKRGEEWDDYTNWVDCVVFGKRAESLSRIISKGTKVAVSGRLRYSSWEKDGKRRSKLEVIANDVDLMQRRDGDGSGGSSVSETGNYSNAGQRAPQTSSQDASDYYESDDIPF